MGFSTPELAKAYQAAYYLRNRERVRARQKEYCAANADKIVARVLRWAAKNPDKVRANKLRSSRKHRGIIPTRPEPSHCELCSKKPRPNRGLRPDHNHKTGKFRGWICDGCNAGIGLLGDGSSGIRLALVYMERAGEI